MEENENDLTREDSSRHTVDERDATGAVAEISASGATLPAGEGEKSTASGMSSFRTAGENNGTLKGTGRHELTRGKKEDAKVTSADRPDKAREKEASADGTSRAAGGRRCQHPFRDLIGKRERRREELEKVEGSLRERLDMLECSVPAVMVWNIWRMAQGAPACDIKRILEKQFKDAAGKEFACRSTPSRHYDCRVREVEAERKVALKRAEEARALWEEKLATLEERKRKLEEAKRIQEEQRDTMTQLSEEAKALKEAIERAEAQDDPCQYGECGEIQCKQRWLSKVASATSIESGDIQCLEKLQQLAEEEMLMKKEIAELERREEAYMRTLQRADELWSSMEGDAASTTSALREQLDMKTAANQQLADRVCELEDALEKCRTKLSVCRTELEKYLSVEMIEAIVGRDDDVAAVADKAIAAKVKVVHRPIGRPDDVVTVKDDEELAMVEVMDEAALVKVEVVDEETLAMVEITEEEALARVEVADEEALAAVEVADEEALARVEVADEEALARVEVADEEALARVEVTDGEAVTEPTDAETALDAEIREAEDAVRLRDAYEQQKDREVREYLAMYDTLEQLYEDGEACPPDFVCNDEVVSPTGMTDEELIALGVEPAESTGKVDAELAASEFKPERQFEEGLMKEVSDVADYVEKEERRADETPDVGAEGKVVERAEERIAEVADDATLVREVVTREEAADYGPVTVPEQAETLRVKEAEIDREIAIEQIAEVTDDAPVREVVTRQEMREEAADYSPVTMPEQAETLEVGKAEIDREIAIERIAEVADDASVREIVTRREMQEETAYGPVTTSPEQAEALEVKRAETDQEIVIERKEILSWMDTIDAMRMTIARHPEFQAVQQDVDVLAGTIGARIGVKPREVEAAGPATLPEATEVDTKQAEKLLTEDKLEEDELIAPEAREAEYEIKTESIPYLEEAPAAVEAPTEPVVELKLLPHLAREEIPVDVEAVTIEDSFQPPTIPVETHLNGDAAEPTAVDEYAKGIEMEEEAQEAELEALLVEEAGAAEVLTPVEISEVTEGAIDAEIAEAVEEAPPVAAEEEVERVDAERAADVAEVQEELAAGEVSPVADLVEVEKFEPGELPSVVSVARVPIAEEKVQVEETPPLPDEEVGRAEVEVPPILEPAEPVVEERIASEISALVIEAMLQAMIEALEEPAVEVEKEISIAEGVEMPIVERLERLEVVVTKIEERELLRIVSATRRPPCAECEPAEAPCGIAESVEITRTTDVVQQTEIMQITARTASFFEDRARPARVISEHLKPPELKASAEIAGDRPEITGPKMLSRKRLKDQSTVTTSSAGSQTDETGRVSHDRVERERPARVPTDELLRSIKIAAGLTRGDTEREIRTINYGRRSDEMACNCCLCGRTASPPSARPKLHAQPQIDAKTMTPPAAVYERVLVPHKIDRLIPYDRLCPDCKTRIQRGKVLRERQHVERAVKKIPRDRESCSCATTNGKAACRAAPRKGAIEKRDQCCSARIPRRRVDAVEQRRKVDSQVISEDARTPEIEPFSSSCICFAAEKTDGELTKKGNCHCAEHA